MLEDRREFACETIDFSPGGLLIRAQERGRIGQRVIVYLDTVGRIEGTISRIVDEGFALTISATIRKRDKLAAQLTWLANRASLGLPEDRRHERVVPRNPRTILTLDNNQQLICRFIDVSSSGCAVATDQKLSPGTKLVVGSTPARVVRSFDGGLALEFMRVLSEDEIANQISA
jgi:hypothetical protein